MSTCEPRFRLMIIIIISQSHNLRNALSSPPLQLKVRARTPALLLVAPRTDSNAAVDK